MNQIIIATILETRTSISKPRRVELPVLTGEAFRGITDEAVTHSTACIVWTVMAKTASWGNLERLSE